MAGGPSDGRVRDPAGNWQPPWRSIVSWIHAETQRAAGRYKLPGPERDELFAQLSALIVERMPRFDPTSEGASLETWVRRHCVWGIADYWRARLRHERRESATDPHADVLNPVDRSSPTTRAVWNEFMTAFDGCVQRLTEKQRERFVATNQALGSRAPLRDVAKSFGIGIDSLRESAARAAVLVRRCLESRGFSPSRDLLDPRRTGSPPV